MAGKDRIPAGKYAIEDFVLGLINDYRYGYKTAEEVCSAWDEYRSTHSLFYNNNEDLRRVCETILPETCAAYSEPPDDGQTADDKKLAFWKGLKDCNFLLRYGKTFKQDYEDYLAGKGHRCEPIEYTDRFLRIEPEMEKIVRAETGEGNYMGFCHTYWNAKKRVLKEQFGIDWLSPADRYPGIFFD